MRTRRGQILAVLAIAALGCFRSAATAATPYAGWRVDAVRITGLPAAVPPPPVSQLALGSRGGFLRSRKAIFTEKSLLQDRERILLYLARRGLPRAAVETELQPDRERERLVVVFRVVPGPLVTLGAVTVSGAPPEPAGLADPALGRLVSGRPFSDEAIHRTASELAGVLRGAGYAHPRVAPVVTPRDSSVADVDFAIVSGPRHVLAGAVVEGLPEDLEPLAVRAMDIAPGRRYSPDAVAEAREALRELNLFRQVRVETEDAGADSLLVRAQLRPAPFRTLRLSVGSWTDEAWRLRARWLHRNLLRRGRGGELFGSLSRRRREIGAGVWWPALLTPRSRIDLRARWELQDEESFRLENLENEIALVLRPAPRTTLRLGATFADVDVDVRTDDPEAFRADDGRLVVFTVEGHRDRADDLLDPRRGHRLTMTLAWSPAGRLSKAPFVSAETSLSGYLPLRDGLVLAGRLGAGAARPLGDAEDLLPNRRFYAGGPTTMRGFGRWELGPADADGDPLGGELRLLAGVELRAALFGPLGLAWFVDSGQVWATPGEARLDALQVSTGPGLILNTPLGPVRLDVGRVLTDPPPGRDRTAVHLAIGHPF